jgi:hypothetical protein
MHSNDYKLGENLDECWEAYSKYGGDERIMETMEYLFIRKKIKQGRYISVERTLE